MIMRAKHARGSGLKQKLEWVEVRMTKVVSGPGSDPQEPRPDQVKSDLDKRIFSVHLGTDKA